MSGKLIVLAAVMMLTAGLAVAADGGQDGVQNRQTVGRKMMSDEERNEQRAKMRNATSQEEREKIRAEHHEKMKQHAKEKGETLPDKPPVRPQGGGMGGGMGGMGGR